MHERDAESAGASAPKAHLSFSIGRGSLPPSIPKSYPLGKTKNLKTIGSISKEAVLSEESFIVGVDPTVSRPTKELLAANPAWWKAKTQPFAAKGCDARQQ